MAELGGFISDRPPYVLHDRKRHADVWRLAAYDTANCLVAMELRLQRLYGLKPVELLVFHVLALASVQKSIRDVRQLDPDTSDIIPHDFDNGTISRRRIAEATALPRSTVARVLEKLIERGMVVETGRGRLQVPVGVVLQGPFAADIEDIFAPIVLLFDQLYRMGVIKIRNGTVQAQRCQLDQLEGERT